MKILITGICGFVGYRVALYLTKALSAELYGVDNLIRPGSHSHAQTLRQKGIRLVHGDIRAPSDLENLPAVDWIIDAAAQPSVLAGVDGQTSSRQLVEHNLYGTINLLEFARSHGAGLILLSTSRVYSIPPLAQLKMEVADRAFSPVSEQTWPEGLTPAGVDENFSTASPVSLYGATKIASETMALEYGQTFDLPVWINRCGVLAGAGQFGRPDQGIFAYWLHSWQAGAPLRYIGFDGQGHQVRDCLHPDDLAHLLTQQLKSGSRTDCPRLLNVSGGLASACSLRQLSDWCTDRWGSREVKADPQERPFDIPWMVLNASRATQFWEWKPQRSRISILEEIAAFAEVHPEWLQLSAPW